MSELVKQDRSKEVAKRERTQDSVTYSPRFDIWEGEDELRLHGDLPGVDPGDLDIQFEQNELTIHGKVGERNSDRQFLGGEYGVGDFHRSFSVGETIDAAKISAELSDGVLTVHLPKAAAVRRRRIEVKGS